eukprot:GFKZ01009118.1.p1 GENE.GFKZ01009118.1~~GFKZ01009118.1.p1  ORF type:complete len:792 (-),score=128.84 GFKZ01009118.1:1827-4202(-)
MPSATRAESLVGISEVIDGKQSLPSPAPPHSLSGFAMTARASSRASFPPLGPPDMLYVRKRYIPVVGATQLYGYYHFVRGVDVSQPAAISAYIVDVVRNNGLDPLPWVATGGWEIASATFATYNIISKADIMVHVDFPGSTSVIARGSDSRDVELTDLLFAELLTSTVVRDILRVGEDPFYPCLRVISAVTAQRIEPLFLDAATECVHRWHLSGVDTLATTTESAARSRIATAIRDHFLNNARFDDAIEFFTRPRVLQADPDCATHAATAARIKGDVDKASHIIDDLIEKAPQSEMAWLERARLLRAKGDLEKAMEACKTAAQYSEENVELWVFTADLHVDLKQYGEAFEALNSADMPPPNLDPFLRKLVPNRKNVTTPIEGASKGMDAVRVLASRLREEKNKTSDKTDDMLSELPGKLMTDAEKQCYAVLVKILNDLSWDDMLAVRGECFVMETDVENNPRMARTGDEDASESENEDFDDVEVEHGESQPQGTDAEGTDAGDLGEAEVSPSGPDGEEDMNQAVNGLATVSLEPEGAGGSDQNGPPANGNEPSADAERQLLSLEQLGKKVCKPWLDYLVTNMYQDLRAMAMWNAEEQPLSAGAALVAALEARKARREPTDGEGANASAPDDIEDQNHNDYRRSPEEVAKTTARPPVDWLRRGDLAARLGKREEAKTAYWICVRISAKNKSVAVSSLLRIMKMSSEDGDSKTTLRCADAIWNYLDSKADRNQASEPTAPVPDIRSCVFRLISNKGLRAVRDVVSAENDTIDRKRMEGLLLDAVAQRVDGFSR